MTFDNQLMNNQHKSQFRVSNLTAYINFYALHRYFPMNRAKCN